MYNEVFPLVMLMSDYITPVMYSDITGNMPQLMKWAIGAVIIVGLAALTLTVGGAILSGALVGAFFGAGTGLISGISFDENGFSMDWDRAATGFMIGSIVGAISGSFGAQVKTLANLGTFAQRGIMVGANGTLSLGAYMAQAGINGDRVSLGGAAVALGTGLFSGASSTGNKMFDAFWGPMMSAEAGWTYDLLSSAIRKSNVATTGLLCIH